MSRGVEEDTGDLIPKLSNTIKSEEVPVETNVENENNAKVVS